MTELSLDTKILVAVSGGVDSVYMLHTLVEQGYTNLGVIHVNHMIRDDAEDDVRLVEDFASKLDLTFHYMEYDIPQMAKRKKQSIELTAREARRTIFDSLVIIHDYEWVALGHNADDQAETVLYNFIRGTGVHGLAGMLAIDEKQNIYRPLLNLSKNEIYCNATDLQLQWHEDITNYDEDDNDRAWLRHKIIPLLETRRKGTKKVLIDTAARFQDMSDFFKGAANDFVKHNQLGFLLCEFIAMRETLRAEILGALWEKYNGSRKGFSNKVVFEVNKWLNSNPQGGTEVYFGVGKLTMREGIVSFKGDQDAV